MLHYVHQLVVNFVCSLVVEGGEKTETNKLKGANMLDGTAKSGDNSFLVCQFDWHLKGAVM